VVVAVVTLSLIQKVTVVVAVLVLVLTR